MSTLSDLLKVIYMEPGQSQPHVVLNEAIRQLEKAICGRLEKNVSAGGTIALTNEERINYYLFFTGTPAAAYTITVEPLSKFWIVYNDTTQSLTFKTTAGTGIVVAAATATYLMCDGDNIGEW